MTAIDPRTASCSPALSAPVRRFLEPPRFAIVATLNPDGSPLQAVIWYLLDGEDVVFNSMRGRQWPSNLQRDQRVSITVADGYDYVDLRGEVEIDEDPERSQAVIARLTRRYERDPEKAEAQIAGFRDQPRVTFRLRPSRVFARLPTANLG
jgi:PPOX class probable F420-dependent enzyme